MAIDDLTTMLGKQLLVGITYVGRDEQIQFAGTVVSVDPLVAIDRHDGGAPFTLPPAAEAYDMGTPGEYRLRSTGEVVVDPDFITTWTVEPPED